MNVTRQHAIRHEPYGQIIRYGFCMHTDTWLHLSSANPLTP